MAESAAVRDAEPVMIVRHEDGKCIRSRPARIIEVYECGATIHRAADRSRFFKAIPSCHAQCEGSIRAIGRAFVLRAFGTRAAKAREDRSNIADIMLKCLHDGLVFRFL